MGNATPENWHNEECVAGPGDQPHEGERGRSGGRGVGTSRGLVSPWPSRPLPPWPKVNTSPSAVHTTEWLPPHAAPAIGFPRSAGPRPRLLQGRGGTAEGR